MYICMYGLDSDYILSYRWSTSIYLFSVFVEKLCPMEVAAGCNSSLELYGIKVINMPDLKNVIIKLVLIIRKRVNG